MASHGRNAAAALALGAGAAAAAFTWGVVVERNRYTVRHEVLPVLEPGARSITVLHLSDLHMAPWQTAKQEWVASLARIVEPDLVIDTGDNMGHADGLDGLKRALDPYAGIPGVFAHGSNDYYAPVLKNPFLYFGGPSSRSKGDAPRLDTDALDAYLTDELGWLSLENAARAIEMRGSRLEFFGTKDAHRGWDRLDALPGAIEEMRENVGWNDEPGPDPVAIGVTHAPYKRVLDAFVSHGASVIFAGHTHGGQVRIPGRPALVTNCDIPREKAQGLSTWHHARHAAFLEVSAGLGTSIYAPFRFACAPEAVVVTLTGSDIGYP